AFPGTSSGSFMHSSIPERRSEPRSPVQFRILVFAGDPVVEAKGITRDVSQRGVFFYTELPVAIGQVVEFRILMPGQGGTSAGALCSGTVIRVERGSRDAVHAPGVALQINSIQLW
ncbi:MAG TPA: PilZ domain-containing protein, partial [Candidatus Bathyarchaeia archaeon]|nr:PilZ domain-containing protein [Candidatus Bathyarchaeia archaeon]